MLNGKTVAIKKQMPGSSQEYNEFIAKLSLMTELKHKNIVELLGFSDENNERHIVYEYCSNNSLYNFLNGNFQLFFIFYFLFLL